jgi:hypothetical protein
MKPLHLALLALLLVPAPVPALAAPAGTRHNWEIAPWNWIRRKPAEKGAPANGHPLRVDAAILVQALGALRFESKGAEEPLFAPSEAKDLGKAMAEALAVAEPGEDLELLSTSKRDAGTFGDSLGVTARVFVRDGRLNLIVHDARLEFVRLYYAEFKEPKFEYGSRASAGTVVLKAAGAELRRPDWVVLPLVAAAPVVNAQPLVPLPAQPAATPPSLEQRLRDLKHLREQNLITEEDYAKKKEELLKGL